MTPLAIIRPKSAPSHTIRLYPDDTLILTVGAQPWATRYGTCPATVVEAGTQGEAVKRAEVGE